MVRLASCFDERQDEDDCCEQNEAADLFERFHPGAGLRQESQKLRVDADENIGARHAEAECCEDDQRCGDRFA